MAYPNLFNPPANPYGNIGQGAYNTYGAPVQNNPGLTPPASLDPNAAAGTTPQQPQSGVQKALSFLSTPGGGALTNLVGSGLQAYGQYQQQQQQLKQSAAQFAANSTQNQFNADRQDQLARAAGVLNADPLGADQKLAQHNALLSAILPNLKNTNSGFGSANRGGIMAALPQNGFDPAMVNQNFGPGATAAAIAQRHQEINSLDPNAATPNLQSLFGNDPAVQKYQPMINQWAQELQQKQGADKAAFEQKLQGYINQMALDEQKQGDSGGGFWSKFAKIASVVGAGVATVMTAGGASPLLAGAIAAGSGAVGGAANGGGASGALQGAILGGATNYLGGKLKGSK